MIPATFDYVRAGSVDEAIAALREHGDEAKLLAGGHSLLPLMKLRFATPEVLVDLGRIDALRGVSETDDGQLAIGAMTTHDEVLHDPLVRDHCGILAEVTAVVGDAQVRHRGTIGGALAHGDAAGDLPAALLALEGSLLVRGPGGQREIAAADLFVDYLTTSIAEDEVVTEVRVPKLDASWAFPYEKFARVSQAWAIVGACALVKRGNGTIDEARVGLTHMATVPLRATATEQALAGASADAVADAAAAAAEDTDPPSDLNADATYRQHLARVLTRRALETALS
jgi:aerobic carbon-monoxide dehydrogenase medium subunit